MSTDAAETTPELADELPALRGAEQFITDARTEKVLADNHLDYQFLVVDLADIDLTVLDRGAPDRQMRDEVIHVDVAQRYADDLKWGCQFPAGVLSRHPSKFRVVDFHHRLAAARAAGLTQVSAYVVDELEDFDLVELGNLLNRNHGVPLSENERIRQALWGLDLGRFRNIKEAARVLGIPENKVGKEKRLREARALAEQAGVSLIAFGQLPKGTQDRLASIDSPAVFKEAANTIINKALDTVEAGKLVTQINSAGGDDAKIEVIKSFAAASEPRKAASVSNLADPWFRVHTACRAILAVDLGAEFDMSLRRRKPHELDQLRAEITSVTENLAVVVAKIDGVGSSEIAQVNAG